MALTITQNKTVHRTGSTASPGESVLPSFTASGQTGTVSWSDGGVGGKFDPSTGATVTYYPKNRTAQVTITATDSGTAGSTSTAIQIYATFPFQPSVELPLTIAREKKERRVRDGTPWRRSSQQLYGNYKLTLSRRDRTTMEELVSFLDYHDYNQLKFYYSDLEGRYLWVVDSDSDLEVIAHGYCQFTMNVLIRGYTKQISQVSLWERSDFTPLELTGLRLWVPTAYTDSLWQENSYNSVVLTRATADNDKVGHMDDPSPSAHIVRALSQSVRPVLLSDATRKSFLDTATGSAWLVVYNSKRTFNAAHTGEPFTFAFWAKKNADGQYGCFVSNNRGSVTYNGVGIYVNPSNKVEVYLTNNLLGDFFTSTQSFLVSDGWQLICIKSDGTTGYLQIGNKPQESFPLTNTNNTSGDATFDLYIGRDSDAPAYAFNGGLSDIVFCNALMSASELDLLKKFNPARTSSPLARRISNLNLVSDFSHLHSYYDFSDMTTLFQDVNKTVAVASNNDPIRVAVNKASAWTLRDAVATTDANRPLFKTSVQNGRAAALWDGVDDHLDFTQELWHGTAQSSTYVVFKNYDQTNGSHLLYSSNTVYAVVTGDNYSGNPNAVAYVSVHCTNGFATSAVSIKDGAAWHLLEIIRDGRWIQVTLDGVQIENNSVETFAPYSIGRAIAGWELDGYVYKVVRFSAAHTGSHRTAIRQILANEIAVNSL
jgi:hypothetical protein